MGDARARADVNPASAFGCAEARYVPAHSQQETPRVTYWRRCLRRSEFSPSSTGTWLFRPDIQHDGKTSAHKSGRGRNSAFSIIELTEPVKSARSSVVIRVGGDHQNRNSEPCRDFPWSRLHHVEAVDFGHHQNRARSSPAAPLRAISMASRPPDARRTTLASPGRACGGSGRPPSDRRQPTQDFGVPGRVTRGNSPRSMSASYKLLSVKSASADHCRPRRGKSPCCGRPTMDRITPPEYGSELHNLFEAPPGVLNLSMLGSRMSRVISAERLSDGEARVPASAEPGVQATPETLRLELDADHRRRPVVVLHHQRRAHPVADVERVRRRGRWP